MAERPEARPSFEQVSGLLAEIPQDKLILLKHKLNCTRQDTRSCKLLQAMILLTLRREADARMILNTLGDDVAAAHLCRSHWGSMQVSGVHRPKEEPQVAQALAQIYSLLVEEKLCCPQARDEAYQAAIEAFHRSNGDQRAKLDSLLAEARDKCGLGFATELASGETNTLKSDPEKFSESILVPINDSLVPLGQPLRSTGTPASSVSHFEISQSPTVPYLTRAAPRCGDPEVSKLCGNAASSSAEPGEGTASPASPASKRPGSPGSQDQPKSQNTDDSQGGRLGPLVSSGKEDVSPVEKSFQSPVECTEPSNIMPAPLQDLREGTRSGLQVASTLRGDLATEKCIPTPLEDSSSPSQSAGLKSASSSTNVPPVPASSSADPPGDENQFFMFVVVHANEDENIACRVKDVLENRGIRNGATLCEDFLVPGHPQLACFQDALDNSAYTLLLLTKNFKSRLCKFQTNMALMNSFTHTDKNNSVIPFVPKECPLKNEEIPRVLAGIVVLNENSSVFEQRVKRTFRQSEFEKKKAAWSVMQQMRRQKQLQEQSQEFLQMQQRLAALSLESGCLSHQMPFPPTPAGIQGLHHVPPGHAPLPFFPPTFSASGMFQPPSGPDQAIHSQPFAVPTSVPQGPRPQLIIQNAQMVQIGDYSQMQVERTNAALGAAEGDVSESQGNAAGVGSRQSDGK